MIDPEKEQLISLTDAAKSLPGRPNITTVWRWRQRGVRGVKLETFLIGGRRYTSIQAIRRFQERVTAAADGHAAPTAAPRQREAAIASAEAELAKAGW